jgi:hypothetical protein
LSVVAVTSRRPARPQARHASSSKKRAMTALVLSPAMTRAMPNEEADLAEDPLGQGTALRRGQALGRGQPRQASPEPGSAQDVGHPAVADPPAAVARVGQDEGDRPLAVGRVLRRRRQRSRRRAARAAGGWGARPGVAWVAARPRRTGDSGPGARRTGSG